MPVTGAGTAVQAAAHATAIYVLTAADQPTATLSMMTVPRAPLLCEVAASPASRLVPRLSVTVEPGISVQVTPSVDV